AGGQHRLDQLVLCAGQLEALDVAALARGAGAEQSGEVADGEHGEVCGLRGGDGLGDPGGVAVGEAGAGDGGEARLRELLGEGVGEGGDVDGDAVVLEPGQDGVGEAVAAQGAARLVGGRAGQGDPGGRGAVRKGR